MAVTEPIRCSCDRLNDPWRRYCGRCGNALGTSCRCGFPNGEDDRYCGGCGVTVSPRPPAKVAAVLRLPPPTIRNEIELHEEMRTRRIEVRATAAPSVERTQPMEMMGDAPVVDPGTHGNT